MTLYDVVGGEQFFIDLVDHFYRGVDADPRLRHMYPEDLTEPRANTAAFLVQYWGGPTTYSDQRGHPRLRMRHAPFVERAGHARLLAHAGHDTPSSRQTRSALCTPSSWKP